MSKTEIKKDVIFIGGVLLLALFVWGIFRYVNHDQGATVLVLQDGEEVGRYPLSEDKITIVTYGESEYNLLMISDGEVFVSDANCPDGLCMKQKAISRKGESIICLPHKLVVQIESKEEGELDAVTY